MTLDDELPSEPMFPLDAVREATDQQRLISRPGSPAVASRAVHRSHQIDFETVTTKKADLSIPSLAKDPQFLARVEDELARLPTEHLLRIGDARDLGFLKDESVHLVVTSPPYWTLKDYNKVEGQLGYVEVYEEFHRELNKVWREAQRVLVPGGRLIVVVGDVVVSRKAFGRHKNFPLHADIQVHCEKLGFDNLTPIIWSKIANANFEADGNGGGYLGKPYEPGGIVKNDCEFILMFRKPGGYRSPSPRTRLLSVIPADQQRKWFQQVWTDIKGASLKHHPAPYPVELAERLVRMFSFAGDTVLDPFNGTGSTMLAAIRSGRNSVGVEIDETYAHYAAGRIEPEIVSLYASRKFRMESATGRIVPRPKRAKPKPHSG